MSREMKWKFSFETFTVQKTILMLFEMLIEKILSNATKKVQ